MNMGHISGYFFKSENSVATLPLRSNCFFGFGRGGNSWGILHGEGLEGFFMSSVLELLMFILSMHFLGSIL